MKFRLGCELSYNVTQSSTFILNVQVLPSDNLEILEEAYSTNPLVRIEQYTTLPERNRYLRFSVEPGELAFKYSAEVAMLNRFADPNQIKELPVDKLPPDVLAYLSPSRYCQSDMLARLAQHEFGQLEPGYSRVTAICNWIYANIEYLRGSSDAHTSAINTVTERAGVCRDFAHLAITFCRALQIPARFVSAYAYNLNPPDFHACFDAYLDNRWYLFDATRMAPQTGLIRIGVGRDAADTSFATSFGEAQMKEMAIFVDQVQTSGTDAERPEFTIEAIVS